MPANSPEGICRLFQQYMAAGDINAVLSMYDPEIVFINQSDDAKRGHEELKQELAPFAAVKARFDFHFKQVIRSGDIARRRAQRITGLEPRWFVSLEPFCAMNVQS